MNIQSRQIAPLILSGRDVTAVLGPTNTGKTHLAIERMVAHESGVIGLPLRLLAREVYHRVAEKVGIDKVALITGEEKIVPAGARYSVCTVEAMPRETDAAFVAIDEVQLAADLERGHIFTDRVLHLRGRQETLLLGAATMRGILERLLRGIAVVTRPRMSHLAYAGSKKLTRLPRRSAIVAFSADEVYAIGELVRRQRGGAAVVLGALSPRTRNAQVELYQSGDVDYLIATDAIGMGLNLDVDHVAFAQNRKFDGFQYRNLTAAELGQIAGRAGRHVRDGTFGVTGQVDPFDDELVGRIEAHRFDPVKVLQWRSAVFDFNNVDALRRSIETVPPLEGLTRALPAADAQALEYLSRDATVRPLADRPARVELLWEACALPDYRRIAPAQHADIIGSIFLDLARKGHVDEDYMADQVRRADSTVGDIDTLSHRIAQIRTWTFVSHRPGWLADPTHWQEKTREIEDRLSDALHERLTKRFVDRRTSVLMKRLRENTMIEAEIGTSGDVLVEGHHVGELQGFRFTADASAEGEDAKAVRVAAQKALAAEFEARAERFAAASNGDFALSSEGLVRWIGAPVATLVSSENPLRPRLILLADEQLTGAGRDKVAARAERFVNYQIDSLLKPLADLAGAEHLAGIARGIAFRLVENFGVVERREIAEEMKSLDQESRAALRRLGVRFGAYHIFVPALLKPGPAGLVTLLWALANDGKDRPGFGDVVNALASGRTSVVVDPTHDPAFYRLAGFRRMGRRAVRVDILERLADLIRPALSWRAGSGPRPEGAFDGNAFIATPAMMSILGATADDMEEILKGLGYRAEPKSPAEVQERLNALDVAEKAAAEAKAAEQAARARAADAASGPESTESADATAETTSTEAAPETDPAASEILADAEANVGPVSEAAETDSVAEPGEDTQPPVAAETAPEDAVVAVSALSEPEPVEPAMAEPAMAEAEPDEPAVAAEAPRTQDVATSALAEEESAPDTILTLEAPAPTDTSEEAPASTDSTLQASAPTVATDGAPYADPTPSEADAVSEGEEAPKPILLWRPARQDGRPRHGNRPRQGERTRQGGRDRPQNRTEGEAPPQARSGRERFDQKHQVKGKGGPRPAGDDRPPRNRNDRPQAGKQSQHRQREERPVRFDPDSPFAKLAALRDQLKK